MRPSASIADQSRRDLGGDAGDRPGSGPGAGAGGGRPASFSSLAWASRSRRALPGCSRGAAGAGSGDPAAPSRTGRARRVALADDLLAAGRRSCRCRTSRPRGQDLLGLAHPRSGSSPASPREYSAMSGISFSAPTACRVSESRASMPMTTVDRLTRTPAPPVHVGGGPLPGQDQADRGLALLGGQELQDLGSRPRCCRSRPPRRSSRRRPGLPGSAGTPIRRSRRRLGPLADQVPRPLAARRGSCSRTPGRRCLPGRGGQPRPAAPRSARRPCRAAVELDQHGVSHRGDPLPDVVEHVGFAAAGDAVARRSALAPIVVEQDHVHRLAGLRDDPDRDRVADAAPLGEPVLVRASPEVTGGGWVYTTPLTDGSSRRMPMTSWPGILGGPDVHAAVGQAFQVRVFLGDRAGCSGRRGRPGRCRARW